MQQIPPPPASLTDRSLSSAAAVPLDELTRLRALLSQPLPEIPPVYFYDDQGSTLFEEITHLQVYYQTRTELSILEHRAQEIMARAHPQQVVELGSGAGRKIRLLLDAWLPTPSPRTCTLLDVNRTFLDASLQGLQQAFPALSFRGLEGDFTKDLARLGPGGQRLTLFFGGTLGNLYPAERRAFFEQLLLQSAPTDRFLVGVDLIKDIPRLEAAYNDPQGVTAAFNRRSLYSLNQRFGANFEPEAFAHRAFYDEDNAWIEMRLVATRAMTVRIPAIGMTLDFAPGSELRTEISCKFSRASLEAAARGFQVDGWYSDPENLFALALLRMNTPTA